MVNQEKIPKEKILGLNIIHQRKKAGLTQQNIADALNVSIKTVYNYERGKGLDALLLHSLAELFNCNVNDFYLDL